jgi:hypothetical protein
LRSESLEPAASGDTAPLEAEQAHSEQMADERSLETPTIAPAHGWVKPLAVWTPRGLDRRFASATQNRRLPLEPARSASPSPCTQIKPPERRGGVLVTAELMGDPKPNYVRTELRLDEDRSAPVGRDDSANSAGREAR